MTSLLNAGLQSKANLILTAPGAGNQTGAVYSMVKLDSQLAIPGAGITTHSLSGCSLVFVWRYRVRDGFPAGSLPVAADQDCRIKSLEVLRSIFKKMIVGGV